MKLKLSMAAALLLAGTNAFALENVKYNGEAKLWYQSSETATADMFDHATNSLGHAAIKLGMTADAKKNVQLGIEMTGLTTLGLENNLVGGVSSGRTFSKGEDTLDGAAVTDAQRWFSKAYIALKGDKNTLKVGRQALKTPLAFTEGWAAGANTFEAVVDVYKMSKDATFVGAYVGKSNATPSATGATWVHNYNGEFQSFLNGAYMFAGHHKFGESTKANWYAYDLISVANAVWVDAEYKPKDGLYAGLQYSQIAAKITGETDSDMMAVKVGTNVAGWDASFAYSQVGEGTYNFANKATNDKTMVYTGQLSIFADGTNVAANDTTAMKVQFVKKSKEGTFNLLKLAYTTAENSGNGTAANAYDLTALDLVAKTKVGAVDLLTILTQATKEMASGAKPIDHTTLRVIGSLKF